MISFVNESELIVNEYPLNILKGNYLKTVEDTQNLTSPCRKASRRGFKILHVQFERKKTFAHQICCTHNMKCVYKYLKQQEMPKRVKMLTSKARTLLYTSF